MAAAIAESLKLKLVKLNCGKAFRIACHWQSAKVNIRKSNTINAVKDINRNTEM